MGIHPYLHFGAKSLIAVHFAFLGTGWLLGTEREAKSFQNLPLRAKMILGFPFNAEDIAESIRQNKLPEFFLDKTPELKPPRTRLQAKREEQQELKQDLDNEFDEDSDDETQSENDPIPGTSKSVQFQV